MENEENQNQVSLRFPPPLEIAPRFPQSHNPDDDSPLPKTQNQKARKEPQRLKKPQPPSSGSSFDEKMLRENGTCHGGRPSGQPGVIYFKRGALGPLQEAFGHFSWAGVDVRKRTGPAARLTVEARVATGEPQKSSPLFSPRGEAKCVRGPSVQGARRSAPHCLNNAG